MRAVVLVGGKGTRLHPLTLETPKQMLPVGNRPMLEHVIEHLGSHGVDEAVLSLGFRPDAFLAAYPSGVCRGVRLAYAVEPEPLDTAGAIAFAAATAGIEETFIVVNGDVLTELDLGALMELHHLAGAEATIALTPVDDPSAFGVVSLDGQGRVEAFWEKPPRGQAPSNLVNAGSYVLEPSILSRVPVGRAVSIERETFPLLVAEGTLYALASDARWLDAGTPTAYLAANLRYGTDVTGPGVDSSASVTASVVGPGVVVASHAKVRRCVLLAGCRVGVGAEVSDSILGPGSSVGAGASLAAVSVLGEGAVVAPGAILVGTRLPDPSR